MNASKAASRRRFLRLSGGAVALIPLVNLYGCGGEEREQQPPPTQPQPTQPEPAQPAPTQQDTQPTVPDQQDGQGQSAAQGQSGAQEQPGDVEVLDEANAQAQALGYKHSVEDVDQSAYPNYEDGQLCSNCNLYLPDMGDEEWGGCQLFPGKLVNANGWCSAYVPMAQS